MQQYATYMSIVCTSVFAFTSSFLDSSHRFHPFRTENMDHDNLPGQILHKGFDGKDSLDGGKVHSHLQAHPKKEKHREGERCKSMPNGTRHQPSFFMCKEGALVSLHGGAVTNMDGDYEYPIDFAKPVRFFLDVTSAASRRYDNLKAEVSLYKRSTSFFGCKWMLLPSFGILSNYDVCMDNPSCPLSPGRQILEFSVDPTRLFTPLFRIIHNNMSAYQLVVRLQDNRDLFNDLLCATIQTRIRF